VHLEPVDRIIQAGVGDARPKTDVSCCCRRYDLSARWCIGTARRSFRTLWSCPHVVLPRRSPSKVRGHHVTVRQCHRHVTRSARHLRVDLTTGIGREVDGGGMAGGGSGCPGDGAEAITSRCEQRPDARAQG
jgi:hypothetical protein